MSLKITQLVGTMLIVYNLGSINEYRPSFDIGERCRDIVVSVTYLRIATFCHNGISKVVGLNVGPVEKNK